jgi:hypothetical protein
MLEKYVKRRVSALLSLAMEHGPLYYWMPVTTQFGKRSLDYICCINGQFVAIETKATGEWLRPAQCERARDMLNAGAKVFIISGPDGYGALERYLERCFPTFGRSRAVLDPRRKVSWE